MVSDSTLKRVLSWLSRKTAIVFLLGFLKVFEKEGLSRKKLTEDGPDRRIGIIDGSFMGSHYLVALNLSGKIDYPVLVEECEKRGKELPTAAVLLRNAKKLLGSSFPDLLRIPVKTATVPEINCHLTLHPISSFINIKLATFSQ